MWKAEDNTARFRVVPFLYAGCWNLELNVARKERLFIDYYHPANHWSDLMNYYGLMGIYQQALKEKQPVVRNGWQATVGYQPNVWKNWE